jgi:hypothetical protein
MMNANGAEMKPTGPDGEELEPLPPAIEALRDEVEESLNMGFTYDDLVNKYAEDERVYQIDGGLEALAGRYGLIWRLKPELFDDDEPVP